MDVSCFRSKSMSVYYPESPIGSVSFSVDCQGFYFWNLVNRFLRETDPLVSRLVTFFPWSSGSSTLLPHSLYTMSEWRHGPPRKRTPRLRWTLIGPTVTELDYDRSSSFLYSKRGPGYETTRVSVWYQRTGDTKWVTEVLGENRRRREGAKRVLEPQDPVLFPDPLLWLEEERFRRDVCTVQGGIGQEGGLDLTRTLYQIDVFPFPTHVLLPSPLRYSFYCSE